MLIAAGITGCKDKEEPTTEPVTYSNGLWGANIAGSGGANPDILLYVEGENRQYYEVDWNKVRLIPLDDMSANQLEDLAFDYCGSVSNDILRHLWGEWESIKFRVIRRFDILGDGIGDFMDEMLDPQTRLGIINTNIFGYVKLGWYAISSIMSIVDMSNPSSNIDYQLYKKAQVLKLATDSAYVEISALGKCMSDFYNIEKDKLQDLEMAAVMLDSLNAVLIKQNQLAYFQKCDKDLVNEEQILFSRAKAYLAAYKMDSTQYFNMKTRDDSIAFYSALEPVLSEWAGEGGYYVEQTMKLMDKMVGTYSVATHGQSSYHVGMPSIYRELAELYFVEDTLSQDSLQAFLYQRDLEQLYPSLNMSVIYCNVQYVLYHSMQAQSYLYELDALWKKVKICYSIQKPATKL